MLFRSKRVNFSSRTVISPDPNLSIGEVGVPLAIANEMSVPDTRSHLEAVPIGLTACL